MIKKGRKIWAWSYAKRFYSKPKPSSFIQVNEDVTKEATGKNQLSVNKAAKRIASNINGDDHTQDWFQ